MTFLVLYAKLVLPIFAIDRHAMLFIPFLLIPSALWLESRSRRFPFRLASLALISLSGALAVSALSHSRDKDLRDDIRAIFDQASNQAPIVIYPPFVPFQDLLWDPLSRKFMNERDPGQATSCTLVVITGDHVKREVFIRESKLLLLHTRSVKHLHTSYELSAYHVTGLPRGALGTLLNRGAGGGEGSLNQQAGLWVPQVKRSPAELAGALQPAGALVPLSQSNPYWLGLRLNHPQSTLCLAAQRDAGTSYGAMMVGGYLITDGKTRSFRLHLNKGLEYSTEVGGRDFMKALLTCDTNAEQRLVFDLAASLARPQMAPPGFLPPGVYLTWAGWRGLRRAEFLKPGYAGELYDAGALGDELYLRSGFNEPEGTPPAEVRWTRGTFEAELPVWPGAPPREVVLWGALNKNIRERRIVVEITPNSGGRALRAEATFPKSDFGPCVLPLPEPLAPGIYRFRFTVGTWSPKAAGQGGDARELGFYLDALQLRP